MLIFLDTTFTDPAYAHLITLALVTQSGDELYLEFTDYPKNQANAFAREAVEPLLGRTPQACFVTRKSAQEQLRAFLSRYPSAMLACSHNIDWWLLTDLLEGSTPFELHAANISSQIDELRRQHYYIQFKAPRNHALHDARACMYAHVIKP